MNKLHGKTAFITGGAGGLGKIIGEELLKRNVKVCLSDCNESSLIKIVADLKKKFNTQTDIIYCVCDVSCEPDFEKAIKETIAIFGHLDILINNAAISDEKDYSKLIDVNLKGVIIGTNLGMRLLSDQDGKRKGHIINTSSKAAFSSSPLTPAYYASKTAVLSYSRSVGAPVYVEQTGIKVNTICPSLIDNEFAHNFPLTSLNPELLVKAYKKRHSGKVLSPQYVAEQYVKMLEEDQTGKALVINVDETCHYLPDIEIVWE